MVYFLISLDVNQTTKLPNFKTFLSSRKNSRKKIELFTDYRYNFTLDFFFSTQYLMDPFFFSFDKKILIDFEI